MCETMSSPVTHANASRPVSRPLQDYYSPYQFQNTHGNRSPWTSSHNYLAPRQDLTPLLSLLTPSPRWSTSHPPKPQQLHQTLLDFSLITLSNSTVSPNLSSLTEMQNSLVDFGNP